jgi:formate C-acetyltransferase
MKQATAILDPWRSFKGAKWKKPIDVRDFILNNVTAFTMGMNHF